MILLTFAWLCAVALLPAAANICIYDRRLLSFSGQKTSRNMVVPGYFYDETVGKLIEETKKASKEFVYLQSSTGAEIPEDDHEPEEGAHSISFKALLLIFGILVVIASTRLLRGFPPPVTTLLTGILFSVVYRISSSSQGEGQNLLYMHSEHTVFAFTPVLILGEMLRLDVRLAKRLLLQFFFYGLVGGVLNTLICTGILRLLLPAEWHFYLLLSVGALISTSDASYMGEMLTKVGVPQRVVTLVGGESMSNDPALFAVLTLAKEFYTRTHLNANDEFPTINPMEAVSMVSRIVFAGITLGGVMGLITLAVIDLTSNRFESENHIYQIVATLACGYATFLLAEGVFGMSGAISVVSAGWMLAWKMWPKVISEETMKSFWHAVDFVSESVLYLLIGFYIGFEVFEVDLGKCIGYSVLIWVVALLARSVTLFALWPILNLLGPKPVWKELALWSWCSLKSRIALALIVEFSLHILADASHAKLKREVIFIIGAVTLMSNLVNGTLCGVIARLLQLDRATDFEDKVKSILFKYSLMHALEQSQGLDAYLHHTLHFCLSVDGKIEPGADKPSSLDIEWNFVKKSILVASFRSIYLSILKALYWEENEENRVSIKAIQALLSSAERAQEDAENVPLNDFYHLMVILPSRDVTANHYRVIYALITFVECHITAREIFEKDLIEPVLSIGSADRAMISAIQDAWEEIKVESSNSEQYAKNETSIRFDHDTIDTFLTLRNLKVGKVKRILKHFHSRQLLNEKDSEESNEAFVEDMEAVKATMRTIGEGADEHNTEDEAASLMSGIQSLPSND